MNDLLNNRWLENNRGLDKRILASQDEMHGRGVLQSSIAVQSLHEVFREEFQSSREIIVRTIVDSLRGGYLQLNRLQLESCAIEKLAERRDFLDRLFLERGKISMRDINNHAMIAPYTNVAQYYDHAC